MTHWAQDSLRSHTLRICLESLIRTTRHLLVEIIVIDNGGSIEDSNYLLNLCHENKIQFYLRNSANLYFGFARNLGVDISIGNFVVFSDNDIEYYPGWLDKCVQVLNAYPDRKIAITPLRTDKVHRKDNHYFGELTLGEERFPLNIRAGSNSWVIRRKDFDVIGKFLNHRVAGTKWTDKFVRDGYLMATMDYSPLAADMGYSYGYNFTEQVILKRQFADGSEVIINET